MRSLLEWISGEAVTLGAIVVCVVVGSVIVGSFNGVLI